MPCVKQRKLCIALFAAYFCFGPFAPGKFIYTMSCITLLSDLSLQDASVGVAKGILMQYMPDAPIIDISHEVTPFNVRQAAYLLSSVRKNFPAGTVHVVLCDIFSEKSPRLVLCELDGCYYLSPDNGILPLALDTESATAWECVLPHTGATFTDWLHTTGRMIQELQTKTPADLGLKSRQLKAPAGIPAEPTDNHTINCNVIHIDQYENVVLDVTRQQFDAVANGRSFRLEFMLIEEITELSTGYNDVRPGFKLCRFNNSGYLEICVNRGKAASLFGLKLGGKYNDIKINFR